MYLLIFHRGLKSEKTERYQNPMDVKRAKDVYIPVDTPFITPSKLFSYLKLVVVFSCAWRLTYYIEHALHTLIVALWSEKPFVQTMRSFYLSNPEIVKHTEITRS